MKNHHFKLHAIQRTQLEKLGETLNMGIGETKVKIP